MLSFKKEDASRRPMTAPGIPITYTKKELSSLFFAAVSFAAILFLNRWRTTDFSATTGALYFLFAAIGFFVLIFGAISLQKIRGLRLGLIVTYENNFLLIIICFALSFLTLGYALVLVPGWITLSLHPRLRLGHFRPDIHDRDIGFISLLFPIAIFFEALFFLALGAIFHSDFLKEFARFAFPLALLSFLPLPHNFGAGMFKWSRIIQTTAMLVILFVFIGAFMKDPTLILGTVLGAALFFVVTIVEYIPRIFAHGFKR
jgi:hypothetical protein